VSFGSELQLQIKRNILLLVDNCPAYPVLEDLNIKPVFLPVNTASVLQPMDQGVIRSLKCHFHNLILQRMVKCIEKKQAYTVTVLVAIRCVGKVWRPVREKTFGSCFRHVGISSGVQDVDVTEKEDDDDDDDGDDDVQVGAESCGILSLYDL
jgi:hypothetical protein